MSEWKKLRRNEILEFKGFYISYNPNVGMNPLCWRGDTDEETAICTGGKFYILNGDHRAEYEKLAPKGLKACLEYFKAHPELKSSWSNPLEED